MHHKLNIEVVRYEERHLGKIAKSFVESFSEWKLSEVKKYLQQTYLICPECCYIALDDNGSVAGGIFCKISPYNNHKMIVIESLQIIEKYRNSGVGKKLIEKVSKIAKKKRIKTIGMLVNKNTEFPISWFKKMGFQETGWIELLVQVDKIIF